MIIRSVALTILAAAVVAGTVGAVKPAYIAIRAGKSDENYIKSRTCVSCHLTNHTISTGFGDKRIHFTRFDSPDEIFEISPTFSIVAELADEGNRLSLNFTSTEVTARVEAVALDGKGGSGS